MAGYKVEKKMKIIVQKFGGTSVATTEAREAVKNKVQCAMTKGYSPVVVVSAMGRKGDPYATDTLIGVLKAANISVNNREMDVMMCCGELISSAVMTATLQASGINAMALTGGQAGIITDSQFGAAKIKNIDTCELMNLLEAGVVPVVCGFQGMTENHGKFTTLGRGGSDTSAAALGAALNADLVEIYTDVEGIMTADPRIVKDANILQQISYDEICQMAHQGAKVIHPRAVEIAMQKNIPLVVKSTFSEAPGTLIGANCCSKICGEIAINERIASGVTYLTDLVQFRVKLDNNDLTSGQRLFDELATGGVSVGCLNLQPELSMFAVYTPDKDKTENILKRLSYEYTLTAHCGKVSVVGAGMRGVTGVMATFVTALSKKNMAILQTVDSDTTISAIIEEKHVNDAVQALHAAFKL